MSMSDPTTKQLLLDDVLWRSQIIYVLSTLLQFFTQFLYLSQVSQWHTEPTKITVISAMHPSGQGGNKFTCLVFVCFCLFKKF